MTEQDVEPLSESRVFDLLANQRRRRVIEYLMENDGQATLDELVDHVAARENGVSASELTSEQRRRIHVSLTQSHMPTLDEVGAIDYDSDTRVVRRRDRARTLESYITTDTDKRPDWAVYYLLLAAGAMTLFVLSGLENPVSSVLSPLLVGVTVVAGLLVLSVAHLVSVRRE
jgi:CHASE2 domain-containing sensor protein